MWSVIEHCLEKQSQAVCVGTYVALRRHVTEMLVPFQDVSAPGTDTNKIAGRLISHRTHVAWSFPSMLCYLYVTSHNSSDHTVFQFSSFFAGRTLVFLAQAHSLFFA